MRTTSTCCRLFIVSALAVAAAGLGGPAGAAAAPPPQILRFHGGGYDQAAALAVDAAGAAYVAGSIEKAGSPVTFAVTAFSPDGSGRWTSHYSGSRGGVGGSGSAVAVDPAGNVYVAGIIGDGVIFNTNWDVLVVKIGPDGVERWAQRYDGPGRGFDRPTAVVVDPAGNVYVTGFSYGQGFDWATLKYSAGGALLWERRLSGPGMADDGAVDMVLAPNGNLVVAGTIRTTGDGQTSDFLTVTYDPLGTVVWQQPWTDTATSHDDPQDLDIDSAGTVAVTGTTAQNNSVYVPRFPVTLRYSVTGTLVQTIQDVDAGGSAVDVDAAGNSYVAGAFFATPGASSVAKYSQAGSLVWSAPLTASENALDVVAVAADPAGAVTVAATVIDIFTGKTDYLTIRYAANGLESWRHRFAGTADGQDTVAALALSPHNDAVVAGTSWNDYGSIGGTADDMVALRFPAGTAPGLGAPSNLSAAALSANQVRLTWQDNSGTEQGFRVERCSGAGCVNFAEVATVGRDVATYVDGGRSPRTTYRYRVRAYDAGGRSAYSNVATVKTRRT